MTTILEYVDENLKVFIRKDGHNEESQKRNGNHKKERNGNSRAVIHWNF